MNDRNDPVTRLLDGIEPERPPAGLRERTLERASLAWEHPPVPDRWRRIWESRPLRLAWAATVVALVAANFAVRTRPSRSAVTATTSPGAAASTDLQDAVSLPRLRLSYVGIDTGAPSERTAPHPAPAAAGHSKETPS